MGGGQFGSVMLSTSNFAPLLGCQFEDVIVEALLSRIFEHLTLQVLSASLHFWCSEIYSSVMSAAWLSALSIACCRSCWKASAHACRAVPMPALMCMQSN